MYVAHNGFRTLIRLKIAFETANNSFYLYNKISPSGVRIDENVIVTDNAV